MNRIETFGYRGNSNLLKELILNINSEKIPLSIKLESEKAYNFRFIFEFVQDSSTYSNDLLGNLIHNEELIVKKDSVSKISLTSVDELINWKLDNVLEIGLFNVNISVFEELPRHSYGILETLPIPKNILTIYLQFSKKTEPKLNDSFLVQKYFDGYNHLGFVLVDLPRMKNIIEAEYGNKQLDLVYEFSNSEIIEKLFESEIIILTWGINPFTFPIYSTNNIKMLEPLLGKKFNEEGLFNVTEDIEHFSVIPGFELKDWHGLLKKVFPKIKLYGKGKKVHLRPYALTDETGSITTTSFAIYRSEEVLEEAKPLLNIDLLYNKNLII